MNKGRKSVLYLTNIPSPYIVDYLNELGNLCNLTAIFERIDSAERDDSWKKFAFNTFQGIILHGIKVGVDQAISFGILKYLRKNVYDGIIVANPCTPMGMIATTYMKLRKIDYIIESEGGIAKNGKGLKELIKKFVLSGARLYFSTGSMGDEYFIAYGAPRDRICRFPFTTLYRSEILTNTLSKEEKAEYKKVIGCEFKTVLLSIGQFIHRKGMDILLQACRELPEDIKLVIVGGNPTQEYLDLIEQIGIIEIEFVTYSGKESIKNYYKAADIFVLATREDTWGLVIPEAMSFGVPVISTDNCVAAVSLIREGYNGYVVPVENVGILREKIMNLYNDPKLRNDMGIKNLELMKDYSLEKMAERQIEEIIKFNEKG